MINPVTARFAPVTGWAWRPAWWRAASSGLRGTLRLALPDSVRLAGGRLQLAARPSRIEAPAGPSLAHGWASWRSGGARRMPGSNTPARASDRAAGHGERAMTTAATERSYRPGFVATRTPSAEPAHPAPVPHRDDVGTSPWLPVSPVWATAASGRAATSLHALRAHPAGEYRMFDVNDPAESRN